MFKIDSKYILFTVAILILLVASYFRGKHANAGQISDLQNVILMEQNKSKQFQDEAGRWRNKAQSAEITSAKSLEYLAQYDQKFTMLTSDFASLKKDLKNLSYAGWTGTQSNYQFSTTGRDTSYIFNKDTTHSIYFEYTDTAGWYNVRGIVGLNGVIPMISISQHDSIQTVMTRKGRIFKRPIYTQEILSHNPYTKITYNQSVIINRKRGFFKKK